jgi:hypothetical protein
MLHKQLAEFHGPDEIAKAGKALLTNKHLQATVVRAALSESAINAISSVTDYHNQPTTDAIAGAVIREQLPSFKELDTFTINWLAKHSLGKYMHMRTWSTDNEAIQLFGAGRKTGSCSRHYDALDSFVKYRDSTVLAGPLTFSTRIDTHDYIQRHFRLQRARSDTIRLDNGLIDIPTEPQRGIRSVNIEQSFGDMIIFANQPRVTMHEVTEGEPNMLYAERTEALLLSYYMDVVQPTSVSK